jgi:tRNA modification GTPase
LQDALDALARFHQEAASGAYVECLAFELQEAVKALETIVGRVEKDDVLDQIFSQFCLGK